MEYVITTEGLTKKYGKNKALDDFTMHIPKGAIYGFVGKNGAGKTTLIRLVTGVQEPTKGEYSIYGIKNTDRRISGVRRKMGAVVETPSLYLDRTAVDNLKQQCLTLGLKSYDEIPEILRLVGLENTGKKRARNFSLGMKQRLGIAVALVGNPEFLILDEPANGLDPQGIVEMRELILKLNREKNITVLISSHILDELSKLATHYGFIHKGQLLKEISAQDLEKECRKCMEVEVSNIKAFSGVMDKLGMEYEILSDTNAKVYGDISVTRLVLSLAEKDCEVVTMHMQEDSLENYFIKLVGGTKDE